MEMMQKKFEVAAVADFKMFWEITTQSYCLWKNAL